MKLTDFQKTIVAAILSGKCTNVESFLQDQCDLTPAMNTTGSYYRVMYKFEQNSRVYIPKDPAVALSRLKEYVSLWDKLQKSGLIYSSSLDPKGQNLFPIFGPNMKPDDKILSILKDYHENEIVPFPDLNDFVARGYLTTEEFFLQEENRDRKRAQKLTLYIALISIAATLLSSLFQYLTYTTDRTVLIKNPRAFADTTKIIILNQGRVKTDSVNHMAETKKLHK